MDIFFRCSDNLGGGYRLAKYDCDSRTLVSMDESDGADRKGMSERVRAALLYGLGRSMMLATDEQGCFFLGICNLTGEACGPCVNAVFADRDRVKIFRLFELFCGQYRRANKAFLNTVKRMPPDKEGTVFCIDDDKMHRFLSYIDMMEESKTLKPRASQLYAFVTEGKYSDYLGQLTQSCGFHVKNAVLMGGVVHGQEELDIRVSQIYFRDSMRYVIRAGALIAVLFVIFLFVWKKWAESPGEVTKDAALTACAIPAAYIGQEGV